VRIEDSIDPTVGFIAEAKLGSRITSGEALGVIYCRDRMRAEAAASQIVSAYSFAESAVPVPDLVKEVINE
jgi:thymidine phosphorylase